MFLKEVYINEFKILKNVHIKMEPNPKHRVFPVASLNGAGKSTLLQFIFTMLHCSFHEERQEYVQNLLGSLYNDLEIDKDNLYELAKFVFEHKGEEIKLDFFLSNSDYQNLGLDSYSKLDNMKRQLFDLGRRTEILNRIEKIKKCIVDKKQLSHDDHDFISDFIPSNYERKKFFYGPRNDWNQYVEKIDSIYNRILYFTTNKLDLEIILSKFTRAKDATSSRLKENNLFYIKHLIENEKILLLHSNVDLASLKEIANKVFLAAPNTQVFQFLDTHKKNTLFEQNKGGETSYYNHISACGNELPGFFTYDFGYVSATMEAFKKARDKDFAEALETGTYGNTLQQTIAELNTFFEGIEVSVDKGLSKIQFTLKDTGRKLTPEDLSHGELKKLSIFVWLKRIAMENSLILMDEIDIGLHPLWQAEITDDLQKWSAENQFLLATHSPHIINSAHYKNLIVLDRLDGRAGVKQYSKAPLDRDLNTIIKTIMGAEYVPAKLRDLHDRYRVFVDDDRLDTPEAEELKEQILEYESENSSFFQDIAFDLEMRG